MDEYGSQFRKTRAFAWEAGSIGNAIPVSRSRRHRRRRLCMRNLGEIVAVERGRRHRGSIVVIYRSVGVAPNTPRGKRLLLVPVTGARRMSMSLAAIKARVRPGPGRALLDRIDWWRLCYR